VSLAAGDRLGPYRIVSALGAGGMGSVYEAIDEGAGRRVAIKVLARDFLADPDLIARFRREGEAAARVVHPNVARVHATGESPAGPYLVMEYLGGGSLELRLRDGPIEWRRAVELAAQVARGLAAIHAAGLVHRDLKPANVLLDESGVARITDFGLARPVDPSKTRLTRTGEVVGTFEYLAPEQANAAQAGPAADLYALGATLFALVTGAPPFRGQGPTLLAQHLMAAPPSLRSAAPSAPAALDRLVARLLAKSPAARGDAASVAAELEALGRARETSRRWPALVVAVAASAVAAVMAVRASRDGAEPVRDIAATTTATVAARGGPAWFDGLAASERPPLPLPPGVVFGKNPGEYLNEKDGSALVFVPGGAFPVGASSGEPLDMPVHTVEIDPYFIGKLEVTVAQYRAFVQASSYRTLAEREGGADCLVDAIERTSVAGARWSHPDGRTPASSNHPVTQVAHPDASAYVVWAGLRLPSEEEWEIAASWDRRAGAARRYPWGGDPALHARSGVGDVADESLRECWPQFTGSPLAPFPGRGRASFRTTAPVGSFPAGASPCGALDMAGNVSEWTASVAKPYPGTSADAANYLEQKKDLIIVRGGDWIARPDEALAAHRRPQVTTQRNDGLGFRVARSAAKPMAAAREHPAWFDALAANERPPLPLPAGVEIGKTPGEYLNRKDGSVLVFVPGGESTMGTAEGDPFDGPVHTVNVAPFFIGKLEVTVAQYRAFFRATHHRSEAEDFGFGYCLTDVLERVRVPGARWSMPDGRTPAPDDHPVTQVSWSDARTYGKWAGLRLPREEEWEKAAAWDPRTRTARRYPWGNDIALHATAGVGDLADESLRDLWPKFQLYASAFPGRMRERYRTTAPVGSFPAGASPCGALDMAGNVDELCEDTPRAYPGAGPAAAPKDHTYDWPAHRGGDWIARPEDALAAHRFSDYKTNTTDGLGFRVALSAR
jgi:formylglycine-generating enzyme required for sulfatase activity